MPKTFTPPVECPICGDPVPRGAKACPGCGADERSGWDDEATLYDGLDRRVHCRLAELAVVYGTTPDGPVIPAPTSAPPGQSLYCAWMLSGVAVSLAPVSWSDTFTCLSVFR